MASVVVFRLADWPGLKTAQIPWDLPAELGPVPGYLYDVAVQQLAAPAVKAIPELVLPRWVEQRALFRAGRIAEALLRIPDVASFVYEGRANRRYTFGFHTNATLAQLESGWRLLGVDVRSWRGLAKR